MADSAPASAAPYLPEKADLAALEKAARSCRGCALYRNATQTVFGEGPADARLMLVGEQPGDGEDRAGHPFVGPAGRLLDRALDAAGIDRSRVYVTNAVKHFKWVQRGKRRLHGKPGAREIEACSPWLAAEIRAIAPDVIICLGATAAQALLGRDFRVTRDRGVLLQSSLAPHVMATIHPSALLRAPDPESREAGFRLFVDELRRVAPLIGGSARMGRADKKP